MGSSPHARGLRDLTLLHGVAERIIPARAGFTSRCAPAASRSGGSSPHARGLRASVCSSHLVIRIIPARAGFTGGGRGARPGGPDHPRTRGVYDILACDGADMAGSSPHARGLRTR